jgi:hypothetical protein
MALQEADSLLVLQLDRLLRGGPMLGHSINVPDNEANNGVMGTLAMQIWLNECRAADWNGNKQRVGLSPLAVIALSVPNSPKSLAWKGASLCGELRSTEAGWWIVLLDFQIRFRAIEYANAAHPPRTIDGKLPVPEI